MKRIPLLILALALISCQPQTTPTVLRIIDGQNVLSVQPTSQSAAAILAQVGLKLGEADKLYYNGFEVPATYNLSPGAGGTFQIRRAVEVTLVTPDGQTKFKSAALTVGQAVAQNGLTLYANDFLSPLAGTPLEGPVTVTYRPARDLTVSLDGTILTVKSSAQSVGQALAEAGIPLIGLDYSLPAESKAVPANGKIKVVRVVESFSLQQKSIPFKTQYQITDQLGLDTQNLLRAGEPGLAVTRIRVRTEDGKQVSSQSESEAIVRPPVDEIVGTGTKIVLHNIPGSKPPVQYWRAVSMYATWYVAPKRGVVAMIPANRDAMSGQQVYIPNYGKATISDTGAGYPDGRLWIDLAYPEDDPSPRVEGWITVYFLMPIVNSTYVMR